jgi:hypothetical protein
LADLGYSPEDVAKMETPDFAAGTVDDQGKLDEKSPIECPHCHKSFTP